MNNRIKRIRTMLLFVIFIFCFTFSAFCHDWGSRLYNDTQLSGNGSLQLKQTDSINFWLSLILNKSRTRSLIFDGFYEFCYDDTDGAPKNIKNTIDLRKIEYYFAAPTKDNDMFSVKLGRFGVKDLTGVVFSQTCDGVEMRLSNIKLDATVFAGYTGLLNSNTNAILTPINSKYEEDKNDFYSLSPKYIPVGVSTFFQNVFGSQRLDMQGWGFIDMNGDEFYRTYAMLGLSGFLGNYVSYGLKSVLGIENFKTLTNFSEFTLNFYPFRSFAINFFGNYASGENGFLSPFNGFSSATDISINNADIEYTGLIKANGGFSILFGDTSCFKIAAGPVFDCMTEDITYFGLLGKANLIFNFYDDLQFDISAYYFMGQESEDNKAIISLKLLFTF